MHYINAQNMNQLELMCSQIELERNIMSHSDPDSIAKYLLKKSQSYLESELYEQSIKTLDRISITKIDSSSKCSYFYQKAYSNYGLSNYTNAKFNISDFKYNCNDTSQSVKLLHYYILIENEEFEVIENFLKQNNLQNDSNYFLENEYLDPFKYKKMSSILPGLGAMKLKYWKEGVVNLVLCSSFIAFTVLNIYTFHFGSAIFYGFYPFRRFYNGGRNMALNLTRKKQIKIANQNKLIGYKIINDLK